MTAPLLGVDVGGTFTDAVLVAEGSVFTAKTLSTRPQDRGVMEAVRTVLAEAGAPAEDVARFVHGMTVATNALLERRGAYTVLVATAGFTDVPAIGRQTRDDLYTLYPTRIPPLVECGESVGVRERAGPGGVEQALTAEEAERVAAEVARLEPEAVAVCLLWSFLYPEHETRLTEELLFRLPEATVSASSEVAPAFREFERMTTTIADAYVTPGVRTYLGRLAAGCRAEGVREPEIMQSSGGTVPLDDASRHGVNLLLSGPAGGAVAARLLGGALGHHKVLSFDMGGTSTDCAAFDMELEGAAAPAQSMIMPTSTEREVAGATIRVPMVDIHTVSAGGGSVAWVDRGGALKVGPASAGADPGPACYGRGGTDATVTDAHVVLGRIGPTASLAGRVQIDETEARMAVGRIAERLGLGVEEAAEGIVRVATFNMAAALRKVTLERGIDPRGYVLAAFGGAGGLHACSLAEEVGMETAVISVHSGVLSALGLVVSPQRADRTATVLWTRSSTDFGAWSSAWKDLEEGVLADLERSEIESDLRGEEPVLAFAVEARYAGQSHELLADLGTGSPGAGPPGDPDDAARAFHELHEERYGYREDGSEVEIVSLRVTGVHAPPELPPVPAPSVVPAGTADLVIGGQRRSCSVFTIQKAAGDRAGGLDRARDDLGGRRGSPPDRSTAGADLVRGPALCTATDYGVFVGPGWDLKMGPGVLILERTT